jgi:prepilin-type N-terminal cleavage/methylation domain-containing protein
MNRSLLKGEGMKKILSRCRGFSLTELMIVVTIIGILAAIAVPTYLRHIRKTRSQEAITNLAGIAQYEEAYFAENDTYVSADFNPATMPKGGLKELFSPTATGWSSLGRVIPNQPVFYTYKVYAGYTPASGTATGDPINTAFGKPTGCSVGGAGGTTDDYVDQSLNPNWFVAVAWGDQDGDTTCAFFLTAVDRNSVFDLNRIE